MTIETVRSVISRFISTDSPEVIALKGGWGVGKTFFWNQLIKDKKSQIKLEKYCYISLFGMSSMSELRNAVYIKSIQKELIGAKNDFDTKNRFWDKILRGKIKDISYWFASSNDRNFSPYFKKGIDTFGHYFVKDTLICFDDLERLSFDRIKIDEFLGYISELKEERFCKIIIIFNEEKIDPRTMENYLTFREKVFDKELLFDPTVEEALKLAIRPDYHYREIIVKFVARLQIKNIRILKKICTYIDLIYDDVKNLHEKVIEQAISTIVFYSWCYFKVDAKAPPCDFIEKNSNILIDSIVSKITRDQTNQTMQQEKENQWMNILNNYGFHSTDEFDFSIFKIIKTGYLEETGFADQAKKQDMKFQRNDLYDEYKRSWLLFKNSFSDNADDTIRHITEATTKSISIINHSELNDNIKLLRKLGGDNEANTIITSYISERKHKNGIFDLSGHPFLNQRNTDKILFERFIEAHNSDLPSMSLLEVIAEISRQNNHTIDHIEVLKKASVDDFIDLFKSDIGENLRSYVNACLGFLSFPEYKFIGDNAVAALCASME